VSAAAQDAGAPQPGSENGSAERLQKIIAAAGIASRRKAEELILAGRVQVNGQTVTTLGAKADPARDHIRVDGKLLHGPERPRYVALNKPKGYVTTASDPEGRPTVMDLIHAGPRLFPVGRLDYASEGLLLLTNDGSLANALTRAAAGVEKTYLVKVSGHPTESALKQLRHGIMIDRGTQVRPVHKPDGRNTRDDSAAARSAASRERVMTAPVRIRLFREAENPWYEMILTEGRNREIRKMFEEIGHHTEKIRRIGYGPLVLDLEPGRSRELTPEEVLALRRAAAGQSPKSERGARKRIRTLPKASGKKPPERRSSGPKLPRTRSKASPAAAKASRARPRPESTGRERFKWEPRPARSRRFAYGSAIQVGMG
jgi:23S rRNA pseudouridine2605 synthase